MSPGIDLLGDELVRIEVERKPMDVSLQDATSHFVPEFARVSGFCHMCREKAAQERCLHCTKVVCREHFWIMLGLCKTCATEQELEDARQGRNRPRPSLDIKWIEE